MSISIVDVSDSSAENADKLVQAASTTGFVFLEGTGFTQDDIDAAFALSRQFFALPEAEKSQVPITKNNWGYSVMNQENLDPQKHAKGDPKEAFNFSQFLDGRRPRHDVPEFFENNLDQVGQFQRKCHELCLQVLKLLGMGLKIEGNPEWFSQRHAADQESGSILRYLFYPSQNSADPSQLIRAGAHTDYGTLTLLFQKQGQDGLEILSPQTKQWTPVQFVAAKTPGQAAPVIMNIGDLLSFWTAGVLRSTIHRVKFPESSIASSQDRYSIVYFLHPQDSVPLEPVPSPMVAAVTGRGANRDAPVITASEHLAKRLAATYGWY